MDVLFLFYIVLVGYGILDGYLCLLGEFLMFVEIFVIGGYVFIFRVKRVW